MPLERDDSISVELVCLEKEVGVGLVACIGDYHADFVKWGIFSRPSFELSESVSGVKNPGVIRSAPHYVRPYHRPEDVLDFVTW